MPEPSVGPAGEELVPEPPVGPAGEDDVAGYETPEQPEPEIVVVPMFVIVVRLNAVVERNINVEVLVQKVVYVDVVAEQLLGLGKPELEGT